MKLQYQPSPESTANIKLKARYDHFIGGEWTKPAGKKYADTINPATAQKLASVAVADERDVDLAMREASAAYQKYWKKMPATERAKYIFRVARVMQERARELAIIETMNGGKPIRESRDFDIPMAANHFFYYAGWSDKLAYAFPNKQPKPIGVAAQIIPWNFPLLMAAWKIAPALACGNTVVLKSADTTPLTALVLAQIIQDCDLPPGVVNIISGFAEAGAAMVKHPLANKIAFTGSTAVGKSIIQTLAGSDKKLSLELGGKAAHIVFADAPMNQAVEGVVNGIFFNQGHVCCAGSRLFVEESCAEEFISKLKMRMAHLKVGDPLDKNTDVGAINSKEQLSKIHAYLQSGIDEGLEMYQAETILPTQGYFTKPTLFLGAGQNNRVVQEEIFGPVLCVQTFRTIEEVIEKANNIPYGLSAGVWTDKGAKIFNLTTKLKAGVVWANTYNKFDPASPFGGYKESGFGREGGLHGLMPYLAL